MSDTDNPSNETEEYGNQPPAIPDEESSSEAATDAAPVAPAEAPETTPPPSNDFLPVINDIIGKIDEASNILVALSSDPSVDELATAIGLSLSLDKLEKRVTAIYSGETPDALSFLNPEETFETQPDTLQDFVIALNKDKADHLRYKVDGDFVKIFITPYRSRISEEDLEFSYGDFNVDLVIALNVANGVDLDSALREHGRIMHDATIINITTGKPGKLGEIEWSDPKASSVSEMVSELLLIIGKMEEPEATALLTGIIAATDRFANSHTTSHSLEIASQLISAGANQQLVAKNIASELDSEGLPRIKTGVMPEEKMSIADSIRKNATTKSSEDDPMSLDISHHDELDAEEEPEEPEEQPAEESVEEQEEPVLEEKEETLPTEDKEKTESVISGGKTTIMPPSEEETLEETEEEALTEDLEATEATLSNAGAEVIPEAEKKSFSLEVNSAPKEEKEEKEPKEEKEEPEENAEEGAEDEEKPAEEPSSQDNEEEDKDNDPDNDGIVGPFGSDDDEEEGEKVEETTPASDFLSNKPEKIIAPTSAPEEAPSGQPNNPAAFSAPDVASAPETNHIPDMNYMPMPGDEILPPPPTPPVDFGATPPTMDSVAPNPMPPASTPVASASSNPFLNTPTAQPSFTPNTPPANPFGPAMPSMPTPGTNNPFAAQPTMPGQMNSNPPMNNPGSFQIPGA